MHFSWFHLIPGIADGSAIPVLKGDAAHEAYAIPAAWLVCAGILLLAVLARWGLERAKARGGVAALTPDERLSPRTAMELYVIALYGLVEDVLGRKEARVFFPLIGTLFLYILLSNFLGLLPGFLPPTGSISNNFAMGMTVFLVFNIAGIARTGFGYIKHLFGPVLFIAPLFFVIEIISLCVRPYSLSLRLGGNMFGDHTVLTIMSDLVPILVPIPFLGLGMFVCFIQALVFSLLSVVYIALAVANDEH